MSLRSSFTSMFNKKMLMLFAASLTLAFGGCGGDSGGGSSGGGGGGSNVAPRITGTTSFSFAENDLFNFGLTITDPDSANFTITLPNTGDGQFFEVTSAGRIQPKSNVGFDFEGPVDANEDNVYTQTVTVSDGIASTSTTISVTITNINEPPICTQSERVSVKEGNYGTFHTFSAHDPEGDDGLYKLNKVTGIDGTVTPLATKLVERLGVGRSSGTVAILHRGIDADTYTDDFSARISDDPEARIFVEFDTGDEMVTCDVYFTLIDIPFTVSSGVLIEGTIQSWENIGDIDGDGTQDSWVATAGSKILEGNIIYGPATNLDANNAVEMSLDELFTTKKMRIFGTFPANDGRDVSTEVDYLVARTVPDLDGDGRTELLLGLRTENAKFDDAGRPWAYLIWGKTLLSNTSGSIDLDVLSASDGMMIKGPFGNAFSRDLMDFTAADFDGDNVPEIVIGAPKFDATGSDSRIYIINGQSLLDSIGNGMFDIVGKPNSSVAQLTAHNTGLLSGSGHGVKPFGDMDGDGIADLLIGNDGLKENDTSAVAVFTSTGIIDTFRKPTVEYYNDLLLSGNLFVARYIGTRPTFDQRSSDFDGDGLQDLLFATTSGPDYGGIIFGSTIQAGLPTNTILRLRESLPEPAENDENGYGFVFFALHFSSSLKGSLTGIGDWNNDGLDELVIGLGNSSGGAASYILDGKLILARGRFGTGQVGSFSLIRIPSSLQLPETNDRISTLEDIDDDGKLELVFTSYKTGKTAIVKSTDILAAIDAGEFQFNLKTLFEEIP